MRSGVKNTPPSPLFTCALLSLVWAVGTRQSPSDCQCIIALLDGSTAAASDPRMAGRVSLLNESKRTDVEEYQSYKGNPTPPCIYVGSDAVITEQATGRLRTSAWGEL